MKLNKVINIDDLRTCARRRLPRVAFDFIEGGVEDERAIARNVEAFRKVRLLPRYFVDVSARNQSATLFGRLYNSPFGICPTGSAGLWRPQADEMLAQVAAAANIPFVLSSAATISIEAATKIAPNNMWFQLYGPRDRAAGADLVRRAHDAGIDVMAMTVDVPVAPNRERNMRHGFSRPLRLRPSMVLDGLRHPAWLAGYLRSGGRVPLLANWAPYAPAGASNDDVAALFATQTPAPDQTWRDFERYRKLWPGKLVLKGVLHPDDAVHAARSGADGLIVSNHGGRQFDNAPTPLEMLPAIRAAVGPGVTLMLDSGVRRGSDILVAMALGAQFVFVGRATLYGVAAFGLAGVSKAVDILRREVDRNMAQLGCPTVANVCADMLAGRFLAADRAVEAPAAAGKRPAAAVAV